MAATDIAAKVRAAALAAIEKQSFGEDFGVDCTLTVLQNQAGIAAFYTIVVTKRSPLLGQGPLMDVSQIQSPAPSPEDVEQVITEAVRKLREFSAKLLTGQNGNARVAHTPN